MAARRMISLRGVVAPLLLAYVAAALSANLFADRLIFVPPQSSYRDTPAILKLPVPGTRETISAIHRPGGGSTFTVLYSHGNGNDIGQLEDVLDTLQGLGFAVFAYDYEGYGTSSGAPSEAALARDVDAAYGYLTERLGVPPKQIIAYGFSLGGAAALDLGLRREVAAVVLESTFVTAFRVRTGIPLVPFDRFANLSRIARLGRPLLILHARDDGLIAYWHAEALFAAAPEPKELVAFERGGHGGVAWAEPARYASALERLRRTLGRQPPACAGDSGDCEAEALTAR